MPIISLPQYAKIKNNYCICYFGNKVEYISQLKILRPHLNQHFPGLDIYLSCKDEHFHILEKSKNILKYSDMPGQKENFAHIKELVEDKDINPIKEFFVEAGLGLMYSKNISCN
jgi:ketopantoate reductase